MATAFETYVQTELPQRPVLLASGTCGGFDGDPNDAGAPAKIAYCPLGTFYIRGSTSQLYQKQSSLSGTWVEITNFNAQTGLTYLNAGMTAEDTSGDGELGCATALAATPRGWISVFVQGAKFLVGDGTKTADCYFSADSGSTAKSHDDIAIDDKWYWNGTVAGFNLSSSMRVDFLYTVDLTSGGGGGGGGGGGTLTMGAFGNTPNNNGASITDDVLVIQPADSTHPGAVSTGSQTFVGEKTFVNAIEMIESDDSLSSSGAVKLRSSGSKLEISVNQGAYKSLDFTANYPGQVLTAAADQWSPKNVKQSETTFQVWGYDDQIELQPFPDQILIIDMSNATEDLTMTGSDSPIYQEYQDGAVAGPWTLYNKGPDHSITFEDTMYLKIVGGTVTLKPGDSLTVMLTGTEGPSFVSELSRVIW